MGYQANAGTLNIGLNSIALGNLAKSSNNANVSIGYLAGNNIFTGYNTFTKDAIFDGTLTVQGRILNTNKNILLNYGNF
jgi:hypothetical protein